MLGMVFTELIEMVESKYSPELADDILVSADFDHGGAYTAVGYYDFSEMLTLVTLLSERTGTDIPGLLKTFGGYLFHRLAATHQDMLKNQPDILTLLAHLDNHIHPEVNKLYSGANLPTFTVTTREPDALVMIYESSRHLEDLAIGLIEGAAEYFNQSVDIETRKLDGDQVEFHVRRRG